MKGQGSYETRAPWSIEKWKCGTKPNQNALIWSTILMLIEDDQIIYKHKHVHRKKKLQYSYSHMWFIAMFVRLWMGHVLQEIWFLGYLVVISLALWLALQKKISAVPSPMVKKTCDHNSNKISWLNRNFLWAWDHSTRSGRKKTETV